MRLIPSPQIRTKRGPGVVVCRVMFTFDQGRAKRIKEKKPGETRERLEIFGSVRLFE